MYKRTLFTLVLLAAAANTTANGADFNRRFATHGNPEPVVVDAPQQVDAPIQGDYEYGSKSGYPFVSGCCEKSASCCDGLWAGYCGGRLLRPFGMHGGCGKGGCGSGGCGFGYGHRFCCDQGCGPGFGLGFGSKLGGWGHGSCGGKGCGDCSTCGHARHGMFNWMPSFRGYGQGYGSYFGGKGASFDSGCSTCQGGKGFDGPMQMDNYPTQMDKGVAAHGQPCRSATGI